VRNTGYLDMFEGLEKFIGFEGLVSTFVEPKGPNVLSFINEFL